jgi:hypothetical protein
MLGKNIEPTTISDLVKSLTQARIESFQVYEGGDLDRLPPKQDLIRTNSSVIVIRFR